MINFQDPDHQQRRSAAAAAKQAMLQKFRAASEHPEVAQRQAARIAISEARLLRIAEREAAKRAREAEQAARAAELAAQVSVITQIDGLVCGAFEGRAFGIGWREMERLPASRSHGL